MESQNTAKHPLCECFRKSMQFQGFEPGLQDYLCIILDQVLDQVAALNRFTTFKFKLIEDESV